MAFDGTAYHGFQVQENAVTVQEVLQDSLERVLGTRPPVKGCGRTDAGVHAREYTAVFATESGIPAERVSSALNHHLPCDISCLFSCGAPEGFHPRYDAVWKEYAYRILNRRERDPFIDRFSYRYGYPLDIDAMREAADHFVGRHDFRGFMSSGSSIGDDTVRTIYLLEIEKADDICTIRVRGDGFLYNMVRIIAGTLISVSKGDISPGEIPEIIESGRRERAGATLPAKGLCLEKVFYGDRL